MAKIGNSAGGGVLPNGNLFFGGSGSTLTIGTDNIVIGEDAAIGLTSASSNILFGLAAGNAIITGDANIFIGAQAGFLFNGNNNNIGIGTGALVALASGGNNVAIGESAGQNYTGAEASNLVIQNQGTLGDTHTIRIGTQGSGVGEQDKFFVAGVHGVTPSGASLEMATIDANGQMGSQALPSGGGGWITQWLEITTPTLTLSSNIGYIITYNLGTIALTLPSISNFGDVIIVTLWAPAGRLWTIEAPLGVSIDTSNASGFRVLAPTNSKSAVALVCTQPNTRWMTLFIVGNYQVST